MLSSIYKYFPCRLEYFDNFLVRATVKSALNDPFEVRPTNEFWYELCLNTKYFRFGETKEEIMDYLTRNRDSPVWSELGISLYRDSGIVSFCEEKDNLLMWAHYADEHRGMVVEFDIHNVFFKPENGSELSPVFYRKSRLNNCRNNLLEPYFHKSDEWAYEKEHRLILPLHGADEFLISNKRAKTDDLIENWGVKREFLTKFNDNLDSISKFASGPAAYNPNVMCMYKMPPSAIKSVIFGVNTEMEFIEKVKNKLSVKELRHIKLFQSVVDSEDYRIRFSEIARD